MSSETLPVFRYHPDPVGTGAVKVSGVECVCCGKVRGHVYAGPVYGGEAEYDEVICPWCIADGSAHEKLGVSFHDEEGIGGYGEWDEVPEEVVEEVAYRTPGFMAWQQEQWWTHCEDAGQFLGRAGREELLAAGEEALKAIRRSVGMKKGKEWEAFLGRLAKNGSPTAYLFRCSQCGKLGGYTDCD